MELKSNQKPGGNSWLAFCMSCLISFTVIGVIGNTQGLYVRSIVEQLNVSYTLVQMAFMVQSLASVAVLMFSGTLYRSLPFKVLVPSLVLFLSAGLVLNAIADSIVIVYCGFALIGIGTVILNGIVLPSLINNWFQKSRGTYLGIALALSGIGGAVFNPIISSFIQNYGWRTSYLLESLCVLILLLPLALLVKEKPLIPLKSEANFKDSVMDRNIVLEDVKHTKHFKMLMMVMLMLQVAAGLIQLISAHMVEKGFTLGAASTVVSLALVGASVGKAVFGKFMDGSKSYRFMYGYMVCGILGWFGMIALVGTTANLVSGFALGIAQSIVLVGIPLTITILYGNRDYAAIYARLSIPGTLISAFSSLFYGMIFDATRSYALPFMMVICLYSIATPLLVRILNQRDSRLS